MTRNAMRAKAWLLAGAMSACVLGAMGVVGLAMAGGDDRSVAESTIAELDRDEPHKTLVADTLQKAKAAAERAQKLRTSGDEAHAKIADGVAREWAEMAKDLIAASDAENAAAQARRDAIDAGAQAERERALLEEGLARNGRLRAQLEAADREAKDTNRTATAVMDGGAPVRKPKPKPAPNAPKNGEPR